MNGKPLIQSRTMWTTLATGSAVHLGARLHLTAEETAWVASLGLAIIAELRRRDSLRARVAAAVARKTGAVVSLVLGVAALLLSGCAATFTCKSDVQVELQNRAVIVKCLDGSAPTVTINASKVVGP